MNKWEQCHKCGQFTVERKRIQKLIRGGDNVAAAHTLAEVCRRCREWLFTVEQVLEFERVEKMLERVETDGFRPLGRSFELELPESPPEGEAAWEELRAELAQAAAERAKTQTPTGG